MGIINIIKQQNNNDKENSLVAVLNKFSKYLKDCGVTQSFSRAHNPYDNSVCKAFFKNFKQEEIYRKDYRSEREIYRSISEYMKFYNDKRPHSVLGYLTPNKYEEHYYNRKTVQQS